MSAEPADGEAIPRGAFLVNLVSDEPDAAPGENARLQFRAEPNTRFGTGARRYRGDAV